MERGIEERKQEEKNKILGEGRMVFPLLSPTLFAILICFVDGRGYL